MFILESSYRIQYQSIFLNAQFSIAVKRTLLLLIISSPSGIFSTQPSSWYSIYKVSTDLPHTQTCMHMHK